MSYLEKLKAKTSPPGELPKLPEGIETENKPTPPTAKSAKTPFGSKDSTRGSLFSGNIPPQIEPMTTCLHGGKCKHLDGPGDRRPLCNKADAPVFDMEACPVNQWARQQPKLTAATDTISVNQKNNIYCN